MGFELKDGPKGPPSIEIGLVRFRLFKMPIPEEAEIGCGRGPLTSKSNHAAVGRSI